MLKKTWLRHSYDTIHTLSMDDSETGLRHRHAHRLWFFGGCRLSAKPLLRRARLYHRAFSGRWSVLRRGFPRCLYLEAGCGGAGLTGTRGDETVRTAIFAWWKFCWTGDAVGWRRLLGRILAVFVASFLKAELGFGDGLITRAIQ